MKHEITSFNTKRTLAESLKKLMKKKSLSKITVSEIIADCGLNRKTFYYHFEDVYSLLKWIFENEAFETAKRFNLIVDYEEAIIFVMDYIEENDYIINCAYDSIGRDAMKKLFYADFHEAVATLIDNAEKECGKVLGTDYKHFLCSFYIEALAGILIDWMKNRRELGRQQVMEYLVNTMKLSLCGILAETVQERYCR